MGFVLSTSIRRYRPHLAQRKEQVPVRQMTSLVIKSWRAVQFENRQNTQDLPSSHTFVPIALEFLRPTNLSGLDFISEVGRLKLIHVAVKSGEPLQKRHICLRLSICIQQYNVVAFRGIWDDCNVVP